MPARRLGILGGTFNPPHLGHLALARCALQQLALDEVALMPSHTPPHKRALADLQPASPAHRLRMCELAIEGHAGLSVCALEIERGGVSYTLDTLLSLHALHPHIQPTLILGSDAARTLPTWRSPARLLELARLAVAQRARDGRDGRAEVLAAVGAIAPASASSVHAEGAAAQGTEGRAAQVLFLEMPCVDVSSSMVRARAASGGDLVGLVGSAVASYIARHRLYRAVPGTQGASLGATAP